MMFTKSIYNTASLFSVDLSASNFDLLNFADDDEYGTWMPPSLGEFGRQAAIPAGECYSEDGKHGL